MQQAGIEFCECNIVAQKMYNVKFVYLVFMRLCNLFDFYVNNYLFDKLCSFNHGCQVFKVNVQKQDNSCGIKTA